MNRRRKQSVARPHWQSVTQAAGLAELEALEQPEAGSELEFDSEKSHSSSHHQAVNLLKLRTLPAARKHYY